MVHQFAKNTQIYTFYRLLLPFNYGYFLTSRFSPRGYPRIPPTPAVSTRRARLLVSSPRPRLWAHRWGSLYPIVQLYNHWAALPHLSG